MRHGKRIKEENLLLAMVIHSNLSYSITIPQPAHFLYSGRKEHNVKLANRLNAIYLLMLGYEQQEAAKSKGVSRRATLKWVKKWNQGGKEELVSKSCGSTSN